MIKLKKLLSENIIKEGVMPAFSKPKIKLKGKDNKTESIEWELSLNTGPGYGKILINFEPKGKKMLQLALDMEQAQDNYLSSMREERVLPNQLAAWTKGKIGLPTNVENQYLKSKIIIAVDISSLLKKLK